MKYLLLMTVAIFSFTSCKKSNIDSNSNNVEFLSAKDNAFKKIKDAGYDLQNIKSMSLNQLAKDMVQVYAKDLNRLEVGQSYSKVRKSFSASYDVNGVKIDCGQSTRTLKATVIEVTQQNFKTLEISTNKVDSKKKECQFLNYNQKEIVKDDIAKVISSVDGAQKVLDGKVNDAELKGSTFYEGTLNNQTYHIIIQNTAKQNSVILINVNESDLLNKVYINTTFQNKNGTKTTYDVRTKMNSNVDITTLDLTGVETSTNIY